MKTPKQNLPIDNATPKVDDDALEKQNKKNKIEEVEVQLFSNATETLMPELEELVKKNPNRLIGCGG